MHLKRSPHRIPIELEEKICREYQHKFKARHNLAIKYGLHVQTIHRIIKRNNLPKQENGLDLSNYKIENGACYFPFKSYFVIIDLLCLPFFLNKKWRVNVNHKAGINRSYIYEAVYEGAKLHKQLLPTINGYVVDHKNRNTLDNRYCNLRVATPFQNSANRGTQKQSRTGLKGIYPCGTKTKKTYRVRISSNPIIHVGTFDNINDAKKAYNKKALELYGEFAYLHKIDGE